MIKTLKYVAYTAVFLFIAYLSINYYYNNYVHVRSALPDKARSMMQEYYVDYSPMPDFIYCFRAPITDKEYKHFISKAGLKSKNNITINFPNDCNAKWWILNDTVSPAHYSEGITTEGGTMSVHIDGYIYYLSHDS